MLGWVLVKRQQLVRVAGDLRGSYEELGPVGGLESLHCGQCVVFVLGSPDLGQGLLRAPGGLTYALPRGRWLLWNQQRCRGVCGKTSRRGSESDAPADGEHRGGHAAPLGVAQQVSARHGGLRGSRQPVRPATCGRRRGAGSSVDGRSRSAKYRWRLRESVPFVIDAVCSACSHWLPRCPG